VLPPRTPASRAGRRGGDRRGRALFTDGIVRPVFRDDAGHQFVIDHDCHTRGYGTWLRPEDAEAAAPLVVGEPRDPR
jgi:hypothetical protein